MAEFLCLVHVRGRELIENYAANGGDNRLTEDILRQACGMKPRAREAAATPGALAVLVNESGSTPDEPGEHGPAENIIIEAAATQLVECSRSIRQT